MKFTLKECLKKSSIDASDLTPEIKAASLDLIKRVNALGCEFPRLCTSFLRSKARQVEIYRNRACLKMPPFELGTFDINKVPMRSRHLYGEAIDIWDADGKLKAWIKEHVADLERVGLWCEDFDSTPDWVHLQSVPPKSGKRFFKP